MILGVAAIIHNRMLPRTIDKNLRGRIGPMNSKTTLSRGFNTSHPNWDHTHPRQTLWRSARKELGPPKLFWTFDNHG
jgi:hypothetical protein